MGIQVEFNPDLALRKFGTPERLEAECLPEKLIAGRTHKFLKNGQRNYWLKGEVPLLETKGNQQLSRPLASIIIIEPTHILINGEVYTRGFYRIMEVYDINDKEIHFEGFQKIR